MLCSDFLGWWGGSGYIAMTVVDDVPATLTDPWCSTCKLGLKMLLDGNQYCLVVKKEKKG
jgi:hypothetical protein